MSTTTPVLQLGDHRSRRDRRLRNTLALLEFDARRMRLASQLADLLGRVGGDRGVLAWVDEFDPVAPRAHIVVDLLRDRPRRELELAPLLDAWDRGVPGILDLPEAPRPGRTTPGSLAVVSLGSDGRRAWFALVEGSHPRKPFSTALVDELAFRSGAIAGELLHPEDGEAFAGWGALAGAAGSGDPASGERSTVRFMVLRFLRSALADDLVPDPETLDERIDLLGDEVEPWRDDPEGAVWARVLDAVAHRHLDELESACHDLGAQTADAGEHGAAVEAYRAAHELAVAVGDVDGAGRAARSLGRTHRNVGAWDESESWYTTAVSLARVAGDLEAEAVAVDGWANTLRVKGAFPRARRLHVRALDLARRSGSAYAVGSAHHSLLTLSAMTGDRDQAVEHGWAAVESYAEPRDQLRALVSVAAALVEAGDAEVAERAYAVALRHVVEPYYHLFALDGYAHAAALQGDRQAYLERTAALDAVDWRPGGPDFEGQVYLYRGRAWAHLGEPVEARRWFRRALDFSEAQGLSQTLFAAQDGLDTLDAGHAPAARQPVSGDARSRARAFDRLERADRRLAGVGG